MTGRIGRVLNDEIAGPGRHEHDRVIDRHGRHRLGKSVKFQLRVGRNLWPLRSKRSASRGGWQDYVLGNNYETFYWFRRHWEKLCAADIEIEWAASSIRLPRMIAPTVAGHGACGQTLDGANLMKHAN